GNIVKIIREASEVISDSIYDVTWLNKDGKFVTTPEYPQWAWFESLVNACVHRSYSFSGTEISIKLFPDRFEVESQGGFVPPVNEKSNLQHTVDSQLPSYGCVAIPRLCADGPRGDKTHQREYAGIWLTRASL